MLKKQQGKRPVTEGYLDTRLKETKKDIHAVLETRLKETKEEIKEEIRGETAKILQSVDKIVTHLDKIEKDHAADKLLHDRHEKRLERIEVRVGIK